MVRQILGQGERLVYTASRSLGYIGMGVLLAMMLITVADVLSRRAFNHSILGTAELTKVMMVIVAYFALVWCTLRKTHVKIDLVASHFGSTVQQFLDVVALLVGLGLVSLISWQSFLSARAEWLADTKVQIIYIPVYPFYLIVVIGCGMVGLLLLTNLAQIIARRGKR